MDHPFYEVAATAQANMEAGGTIYQKWTCRGCGQRLTMEVPNKFYKVGSCEECGAETDLVETGCNYLLVWERDKGDQPNAVH